MSSRRLPLPAVRSSIFVCQVGRSQHSNLHAHRLRTLLRTGASPTVGPVMLSAAAERVSGDRWLGWPLPPRRRPHYGPRQRDGAARSTRCEPATRRPPQASGQVARPLGGERGGRKRLRAPLAAGCAAAGASRGASDAMPQRRRAASPDSPIPRGRDGDEDKLFAGAKMEGRPEVQERVNRQAFRLGMLRIGLQALPAEIDALFDSLDIHGTGWIPRDELLHLLRDKKLASRGSGSSAASSRSTATSATSAVPSHAARPPPAQARGPSSRAPPSPGGAPRSPEDFSDFILNDVGVGEHVLELLRAQDIGSLETLRMLNLDDLRAIPGLALGPRRKLHEAITELRDGGVT